MSILSSPDGTTPERLRWLRITNGRLSKFLSRAEAHGWTVEPSSAAPDTVLVRHPRTRDHFVLYPRGSKQRASLGVYDGREGYEFSPIPARTALAFIAHATEGNYYNPARED